MRQYSRNKFWGRLFSWVLAAVFLCSNLETAAFVQAQQVETILIQTAEELAKIGTDSNYPMTGDYVLTQDIDLSGSNWTPMGGFLGNKGSCNPAEANVFSGTFDGQGHVISGLTIHLDDSINQDGKYGQVGLFSVVGSDNASDRAEVKNLIFTDVNIFTDFPNGLAAIGTLAGEVNGYASISGIAVLNGELNINRSERCDTVGAGGIIGECRTSAAMGNAEISVTNCYNGANVLASGSRSDLIYAGGILGRVAKSACKEISQCVNTGAVQYQGYDAFGIAAAESANDVLLATMKECYFVADMEQLASGGALPVPETELKGGSLPQYLSDAVWHAENGCYPVPSFCFESSAAGMIYLAGLSLNFAEGEDASGVRTDISLPQSVGNQTITWSSSDKLALSIEGEKAVAHPADIGSNTAVTLTAQTSKGYTRSFKVTVLTDRVQEASFDQGYAQIGTPLKVSVSNTESMELKYQWSVGGRVISNTSDTYTPVQTDLEKFISVTVTAADNSVRWELSTYCSELPVVYVETDDGKDVTSNTVAKDAVIKIQGNEEFNNQDTWYEGATTIKGRGNSTWSFAQQNNLKKPYKLKLSEKANLLGLGTGTNKHWVLLANAIDHTNMRNELAHTFSKKIGMETTVGDTGVVLILNGEYQGIYELSEHIRVGNARVNVFEWEELADDIAKAVCKKETALDKSALETFLEENFGWMSGSFQYQGKTYQVSEYYTDPIPDFTGGFLLDMDFRSTNDQYKYISTFPTRNGIPMFFRAPEYAKTNPAMVNFAQNYMNAYEAAIGSADFTADYNGVKVHYTDLFDMDSLLQYWLLCEYVNNWDSMKNSTYLYKDLEGKAKMGPAWDYDWAWGNINMYSMTGPFVYDQWHTTLTGMDTNAGGFAEQAYQKQQWNRYLVKDPYFVTRAYEYYKKYRPDVIEDIMKDGGTIDILEKKYQKASEINDDKWSYSYRLYSGKAFVNGLETHTDSQTYEAAVASLKTFIKKRIEWMDQQFTDVDTLYASLGNHVSDAISVTAPSISADGTITAAANITDANARYITVLVNGQKVLSDGSDKIPVTDGSASVTIDSDMMLGNMLNTIEILGVNSSGNYISGLMNFTTFDGPEVKLEGNVEVASDREGEISYPGDTLSANVTVSPVKGNLTYQWYASEEPITGAVKASYQLTKDQIGKTISVKVGSTIEAGTIGGTYSGTINEKPVILEGSVKISSSREGAVSYPGDELKVKVTEDTNTGKLSYQWYADGNKIKGASKKTYVLTEAEIGKILSVKVTSDEQTGELTGTYAGAISENTGENPGPGGDDDKPTALTGSVTVTSSRIGNVSYPDDILTANVSESNNSGTLSYQWYAGETAISGAVEASYVLTQTEIGKTVSVKIRSDKETGELTGTYLGTVDENSGGGPGGDENPDPGPGEGENPDPGGDESPDPGPGGDNDNPVALTGTVTIISSRAGEFSYPEDILTAEVSRSNNSGALSYQWYAGGAAITGATRNYYKLASTEIGKTISVKIKSDKETGELEGTYAGTVKAKEQLPLRAEGIKLSVKSKKMYAYQTLQLKVQVMPGGASQKVTYFSDNRKTAVVSNTGKVTTKAPGKARIIVKTADGSGVQAVCTITVKKPVIKITGKTTVKLRKSVTMTAKTYGLKGKITWKLDAKGKKLLKIKKAGKNKIKLTAGKKKGTARLTITCGKTKVKKIIRIKR